MRGQSPHFLLPRTKGGRLRESWLYKEKPELAPRTLRVEPSREAPRAIAHGNEQRRSREEEHMAYFFFPSFRSL